MKKTLLLCLLIVSSFNAHADYVNARFTGKITGLRNCDTAANSGWLLVRLEIPASPPTNPQTYTYKVARLLAADAYANPDQAKKNMVATLIAAYMSGKEVTLGVDVLTTADIEGIECSTSYHYDLYEVSVGTM